MSKEKRRVPKLRFPGFTEDWEQRKLESLGKIITGNTPSTLKKEYWSTNSEGVVWITPTDINSVKTDWSERLLTEEGASQARIVPANSILVTCIASIGKNTINTVEAAFNQQINALVPHLSNSYFILTMLNNMESAFKRVAGTSATSIINKKEFGQLSALLPRVEEQNKIGEIFELIDKSITLHQRKLEHLNLKKKALLQKLFPKNGARYPELRFPGFTDAWEQRKFSEITYLSGIKNKENKPYESYSISNEFGFIPQNEQFEHGGTMKTADKSMYYIVTQNSFAYNPARINVGSIGYYDKPDNVIVSSLYEVFKTTEIVNDKFLWHWFKSNQFNHLIEKYQEGGVRLYFYYDKLCKGAIELPTIDEQNKISNLLNGLDLFITLHQRKLEHLQLQKKALLQQMFV